MEKYTKEDLRSLGCSDEFIEKVWSLPNDKLYEVVKVNNMILIKKFPEGSTCDKGKYWGITKYFLECNNIEWWQDGNGHMLVDCDEQTFKNLKIFNYPSCLGDMMKEAIIENPIIVSPKEKHDDTWFFSRSDTQNFYLVKKSA